MTTGNSPEAVADAAGASAAAPYGTRSRGRNAPRPNYAEDRDMEMELDAAPTKPGNKRSNGVPPINTTSTSSRSDSEKSSPIQPRKPMTNGALAATPKESIPGTSSFSARPEEAQGAGSVRKRKQPAVASSASASSQPPPAKRVFTAAPGTSDDSRFTNMMSFEETGPRLIDGQITSDDGVTLAVNDHVYLVCEPPGEPYYLGRIMEFLPSKNDKTQGPKIIEELRINWYYRPRDIQRHSADPRLVYASMHSDTCPVGSLRGKCEIRHASEIEDLAAYKKMRNTFWYDKMFDRYMHRMYDVIPTKDVINVPPKVKRVLDDRWKFILVEIGKGKQLTGAVKTCKRCRLFAASADSVDCAECGSTYHMGCVRPAIIKKPARGFAWACGPCSRDQDRKLEARNTPLIGGVKVDGEDEVMEEEEEDHGANGVVDGTSDHTPDDSDDTMPQPETAEQMAQARMWPYRYLGIHCKLEDALDYDDRIYPRASSALGPRCQATVNPWPGRPVEYVKSQEVKKKAARQSGGTKALTKAGEAKNAKAARPPWVQDKPPGWIQRGEDEPVAVTNTKQARTADLLFKMPSADQLPTRGEDDAPGSHLSPADREAFVDDYMRRARELAPSVGVEPFSTNFLDKAIGLLYSEGFNAESALVKLRKVNRYRDLKEPHLKPDEVKLFEEGVAKHGSEWRLIAKHVKTVPVAQIVRYYYMWKKTPRGREVWGNYEGRRGKKNDRRKSIAGSKLLDDVADENDDSAFDNDKAAELKRGFQCKFCATRSSRQWRRAPLVPPGTTVPSDPSAKKDKDKGPLLTVSLCLRCGVLWRKYAIQYEDIDEIGKRIANSGSKSWRRKIDEELLAQLIVATETPFTINNLTATTASSIGIPVDLNPHLHQESKQDKKKQPRTEVPSTTTSAATSVEPMPKKKEKAPIIEKVVPEPPPLLPDPPRAKVLPCAICDKIEPAGEEHISCRDCRLTVHRSCYGISPFRAGGKWLCDMCANDRSPSISTNYECVLCPVYHTEHELMETTKSTSRKKSERDKEKERLEREMVIEAGKLYRQRQEAVGKPIGPREPLKRTAGNNWAHVTCSLWTPEIKFGDAKDLEPAEGFGSIPKERWSQECKVCKSTKGACVPCSSAGCKDFVHVGCALRAKYRLGFEVTPVKGARKEHGQIVRLGTEQGVLTPVVYCPNHSTGTVIHDLGEPTGTDGLNAVQLFARTYKQADLTLTGTSRKAAYVQQSVTTPAAHHSNGVAHRRTSTATGIGAGSKENTKPKPAAEETADDMEIDTEDHAAPLKPAVGLLTNRKCVRCLTEHSPKWWPTVRRGDSRPSLAPHGAAINANNSMFPSTRPYSFTQSNGDVAEAAFECHKCHMKQPPMPEPVPEPRPSPYASARAPMFPAPRMVPTHNGHVPNASHGPGLGHTYLPHGHSHPPPPPTSVLARPLPPAHPHSGLPGYPAYDQRPGRSPDVRNGMSPSPYPSGPPPPPPPHHLGGYPSAHPPSPFGTGPPPPPPAQAYGAHQSPYAPISARSPHLSQAPRAYPTSASPPIAQAAINRSPQTALSALNGGLPPRIFAAERDMSAPSHSPPSTQARLGPRGPTPPIRADSSQSLATILGGNPNTQRHPAVTGTSNAGSGASASPSLKNLLS
ncbi:Lid2 complex component snt2-like protein [Penicillium ucsense]|uniref:Lid2 complex component snt2-like protein n=1 Tax=Penicillium ucsense TaxID=2839758 RepID=A0A8J8W4W0_9EURO|nr:Lid2 complex component snt2-like protein [Penicillium ucsense]KAF7726746.1 Lid2 complex component snt2-like protein [Penicillium ucsense]